MLLKQINKKRYRKHLKQVFIGVATILIILTLTTSTLYIHFFSTPEKDHFLHNLAGLVTAVIFVIYILKKWQKHPFMFEVNYVWELKQQLNKIYRKQRKIEPAVKSGDTDAMKIMNFMYRGSKQLYELDDNTLTMEELTNKIHTLEQLMTTARLDLSTDSYEQAMLSRF